MDTVKKLFPNAFKVSELKSLIITIVIYAVIAVVGGLILGLLGVIPLIGWLFRIIGWLVELYCGVGILLAVLVFLGILK